MSAPTFTNEELLEQARGNAAAFMLVSVAYLRQTDVSATDWTRFTASALAPGWTESANFDAMQLGRIWALNIDSTGGTVQSLQGDAQRAELTVNDWPSGEILTMFGLTREDADPILEIVSLLTQDVGATATFSRSSDTLTLIITR